ncbi:dTDP-glucose 4,6-dehydratase [Candidatus Aminicenantes bacterium AC-335-K20]|jgi:dTDP-glucose 4,6-dehydratase|nr:dTDP-glucose 4,6-dehydratase [SCandidatus Aminicenantes bacterium Aminicenantia_JdfR_composite]MCP2605458.1 dTDP-glucose 4,6-dehydratase [Candidatus Aminicenantes bacterium AC-335-O07]MCP2619251.1 dTDP-glucose 4,6-dehydratase [Candidatus Aminicenantes bacterium AC-335-K20]
MLDSITRGFKKAKTFLVTGGAGFMGSEFVRQKLKNLNDRIIVLDFLTYAGNLDNLKEFLNEENIIFPLEQEAILNVKRYWENENFSYEIERIDYDFERIRYKTKDYKVTLIRLNELQEKVLEILKKQKFVFVIGNIMDKKITNILFNISDIIVHYAAETHVDRSIIDADSFIKTDIYGTYILLESLRKNKNVEKFIHVSTDEVYGPAPEGVSFKETDPINPKNPYSASKASADRLCSAYHNTYGVPIIIVRPSNNYGPYQYPEKAIPLFITNALEDKPLPLYGDGKNVRDWLYVEDCCRAIDLVIEKGEIGEVYNIGASQEIQNIKMANKILEILNKPKDLIKFTKDRLGHDRRYSLNWNKIKGLGWKPEIDFEIGLEKTVKWYKENQEWWRKIKEKSLEYKKFYQLYYNRRKE